METLAVAIIAAGASIASAIITAALSARKTDRDLAIHDEKSNARQSQLSGEHNRLGDRISHMGGLIGKDISKVNENISGVNSVVNYLRDEQVRESERRQILTTRQLDINKTTEHIVALTTELSRLQHENQSLCGRIAQLEEANLQLQAQLDCQPDPQYNNDWEMEP